MKSALKVLEQSILLFYQSIVAILYSVLFMYKNEDALQIHLSCAKSTSIVGRSKHVTASIVDRDGVYEPKVMNDVMCCVD
jgi:hypothetical protein